MVVGKLVYIHKLNEKLIDDSSIVESSFRLHF